MNNSIEYAYDSMCIYPTYINGKKRNEWEEGWNAFSMELISKAIKLDEWFAELASWQQDNLAYLLEAEEVSLDISKKEEIVIILNCNDVFYWGCADQEVVTLDELLTLTAMVKEDGRYGSVKWVCKKRNQKPQKPLVSRMKKDNAWNDEMEKLG